MMKYTFAIETQERHQNREVVVIQRELQFFVQNVESSFEDSLHMSPSRTIYKLFITADYMR